MANDSAAAIEGEGGVEERKTECPPKRDESDRGRESEDETCRDGSERKQSLNLASFPRVEIWVVQDVSLSSDSVVGLALVDERRLAAFFQLEQESVDERLRGRSGTRRRWRWWTRRRRGRGSSFWSKR